MVGYERLECDEHEPRMKPALRQPKPLVRMLSPLRDFLATECTGAVLIAVGAVVALVWANSPWSASYERFWSARVSISAFGHLLDLDARHWVNDGLMTIFFLVVGLEIKREVVDGHLSSRRAALLPMIAALGGMIVPALIYLAIAGATEPRGWAIPMATDIALSLGVLAVAGTRLPPSLRAFLLGLAIIDDIGAIVVIAAVYSTGIIWGWLGAGIAILCVTVLLRRLGMHGIGIYVVLGSMVWYALHEAGVHPTLAGVALGLLAPSVPRLQAEYVDLDELIDVSTAEAVRTTTTLARGSVSVVEWLQYLLHPWTSYVIVPIFALANAGVELSGRGLREAITSPIAWGVLSALVIGKPLGIAIAVNLSVRARVADRPDEATSTQMTGIGAAAGIGFTVAIFLSELALSDSGQQSEAKLAILLGSVLAAAISMSVLRLARAPSTAANRGGELSAS